MRKITYAISSLFAVVIFLTNIGSVNADGAYGQSGCVPVYGGGVQCPRVGQVLIDKTVRNPATGIFVDNLLPADPRYRPGNLVTFRLAVKNTGDEKLDKVTVTDIFPQYVDFTSGPGNFDSNTKTLKFDVLDLVGGSTREFEVVGKIVHAAVLPADKSVVCPVNTVEAVTSTQTDRDTSQLCIEKEMVVPSVPSAGPKEWTLSFAGLGTALAIGLSLRKKALLS